MDCQNFFCHKNELILWFFNSIIKFCRHCTYIIVLFHRNFPFVLNSTEIKMRLFNNFVCYLISHWEALLFCYPITNNHSSEFAIPLKWIRIKTPRAFETGKLGHSMREIKSACTYTHFFFSINQFQKSYRNKRVKLKRQRSSVE